MALNDILIKIRTTWEGQGAQSAAKGLSDIETAASRAAPAVNKASGATRVSAEEFSRAAKMASAAGGSIEGIGAIIQQLGSRIAGFAAAIPVIGLVFAAFTAWKTVITTLIERHREHERLLRSIKDSNAVASIDSINKAYERMSTALDRVVDKTRVMMDGQMEMAKVEQELTAAKLRSAETAELQAETDPTKQDAIRARYAALQQSASSKTDANLQTMKIDRLQYDLSVNDEKMFDKRTLERDLMKKMATLSNAAIDPYRTPEERKDAQESQAKVAADLKKNSEEIEQLDLAKVRLVDQLAVERKRSEVMHVTSSDDQTRQGMEVQKQEERVRVAEAERQRAALEQQRTAAEQQLRQAQDQNVNAQAFVDGTQARIAAGTYSFSDNANALQAVAASQEQTVLLRNYLEQIGRELSKQNEILRNNAMIH